MSIWIWVVSFLSKLLYGVFCAKRANDYQAGVHGISQFLSQKKVQLLAHATPYFWWIKKEFVFRIHFLIIFLKYVPTYLKLATLYMMLKVIGSFDVKKPLTLTNLFIEFIFFKINFFVFFGQKMDTILLSGICIK